MRAKSEKLYGVEIVYLVLLWQRDIYTFSRRSHWWV